MIAKVDRRAHSPMVERLHMRSRTTAIVVHHLAVDVDRDGILTVDDAIAFFTKDPEGIATVALAGSYESKKPTIERWKRDGVPTPYVGHGFVPYHFVVDAAGFVYRMLDLPAIGAHAGAWNDRSIGVAFLGEFALAGPNDAQFNAGVALLGDIRAVHAAAEILGHDETLQRDGIPPKGCPGKNFPLEAMRRAARRPAQ
jgi:hypothetical protein